jgi:hypothetical protein
LVFLSPLPLLSATAPTTLDEWYCGDTHYAPEFKRFYRRDTAYMPLYLGDDSKYKLGLAWSLNHLLFVYSFCRYFLLVMMSFIVDHTAFSVLAVLNNEF